ncbi:uncharacterized protein LOC118418792 [Branchiostoma floridae]|uniref:Uncharacterized protein LOC118418792 n=1 Tax=Branchiostoma floridae TaxID=7739 RepID=C3Y3I0_BRAFL|nr:uncharacterized protein LOC118418792 [Branchiostoma floridae]|eukprot:XP_002609237.1 hypothetical protein BRAFLDRAFT_90691 [Branchiostoma floridae]
MADAVAMVTFSGPIHVSGVFRRTTGKPPVTMGVLSGISVGVAAFLISALFLQTIVAQEVTYAGHQEDNRCICTFIPPYQPADHPTDHQQQSPAPDPCPPPRADPDVASLRTNLAVVQSHQLANREQLNSQASRLHNLTSRLFQMEDRMHGTERVQRSWDARTATVQQSASEMRRLISRQQDTIMFLRARLDTMFQEMSQMRDLNQRMMLEIQDEAEKSEKNRDKLHKLSRRQEKTEGEVREFLWAISQVMSSLKENERRKLAKMSKQRPLAPMMEDKTTPEPTESPWVPIRTSPAWEESVPTPKPRRRSLKVRHDSRAGHGHWWQK